MTRFPFGVGVSCVTPRKSCIIQISTIVSSICLCFAPEEMSICRPCGMIVCWLTGPQLTHFTCHCHSDMAQVVLTWNTLSRLCTCPLNQLINQSMNLSQSTYQPLTLCTVTSGAHAIVAGVIVLVADRTCVARVGCTWVFLGCYHTHIHICCYNTSTLTCDFVWEVDRLRNKSSYLCILFPDKVKSQSHDPFSR